MSKDWNEVDQANLNAAGKLYEANAMRFSAEQNDNYERGRPSNIYRPVLSIDGNQWCALYGKNLMEGVAGFGDSPAEAYLDFDKQWTEKLPIL
jgi:hypothetical protein